MDISEKNLNKLTRLFNLMDDDALTREQFVKAFKDVVDFVKKIEEKNVQQFKAISDTLTKFSEKLKNDTAMDVEGVRTKYDELVSGQITRLMSEYKAKMDAIEEKMIMVKDGVDAD